MNRFYSRVRDFATFEVRFASRKIVSMVSKCEGKLSASSSKLSGSNPKCFLLRAKRLELLAFFLPVPGVQSLRLAAYRRWELVCRSRFQTGGQPDGRTFRRRV